MTNKILIVSELYIDVLFDNAQTNFTSPSTQDDVCRFDSNDVVATLTGYVAIPEGDEAALLEASANIGPISVAIDASRLSFQLYNSGE